MRVKLSSSLPSVSARFQASVTGGVGWVVVASHVRAVQALGPHTAPLGMKFYTGAMFPSEYSNAAFVAEHGSWNRAEKIGYVRHVVGRVLPYSPVKESGVRGKRADGRSRGLSLSQHRRQVSRERGVHGRQRHGHLASHVCGRLAAGTVVVRAAGGCAAAS